MTRRTPMTCLGLTATLFGTLAMAQGSPPVTTLVDIEKSMQIRAPGYNKCLDVTLDGSEGREPPARIKTCSTSRKQQRFMVEGNPSSGYTIHPRDRTDLCLDIHGGDIDKPKTTVVLYQCQSRNMYQRWSVAQITHVTSDPTLFNGHWAVFNVGFIGGAATLPPRVLSVNPDDPTGPLVVMEFWSGDFQLPTITQLWHGPEIYCSHVKRKHVRGLLRLDFAAGGHTSTSYTANCE